MWQIILQFGLLAAAVLLLLLVGEYALFVRPRTSSWILAAGAVALIASGVWMGRLLFSRTEEPASPYLLNDPGPAASLEKQARPALGKTLSQLGVSEREYEVLKLVADGLSNQEIADRLYISESTVKSHVSSLLTKLEAKRRTHAVRKARHIGLIA